MAKSETRAEQLRKWRAANPEKVAEQRKRAYERRMSDPEKRALRAVYNKTYRERHAKELRQKEKARDKVKLRARSHIRNRVFRGLLKRQPCEVCSAANAHAHHEDYSKPLDVKWLCPACHARHHTLEKDAHV